MSMSSSFVLPPNHCELPKEVLETMFEQMDLQELFQCRFVCDLWKRISVPIYERKFISPSTSFVLPLRRQFVQEWEYTSNQTSQSSQVGPTNFEGSNKENKSGTTPTPSPSSSSSSTTQTEAEGIETGDADQNVIEFDNEQNNDEEIDSGGASGYECDVEDYHNNIEERDSSSTSSGRTNDTHDSDDYERNECLVRRQWFKAGRFDEYFQKLRLSIKKVREN